MSDLRDLLREAAYEVDTRVLREPAELREIAHRRSVHRIVSAVVVAVAAVVLSALVAAPPLVHRAEPPTRPVQPAEPCPDAVVPADEAKVFPPEIAVSSGAAAGVDSDGLWVAEAGRAPRRVAAPAEGVAASWVSAVSAPSSQVWWSPDGAQLLLAVSVAPDRFGLHDVNTCGDVVLVRADGSGLERLSHNRRGTTIQGAAFSPDGQKVAYVNQSVTPHVPSASEVAAAKAEEKPAPTVAATNAVMVLDLATGQGTQLDPGIGSQPMDDGSDLRWSPDGRLLAVLSTDQLRIFDINAGTEIRVPAPGGQSIENIGWTPDGTLLGAAVPQGEPQDALSVVAWDPSTTSWALRSRSNLRVEFMVSFPGFSPDGHVLLATGGLPGQTHLDVLTTTPYLVDVATGATSVAPLTWSEGDRAVWLDDSSQLLVARGNWNLHYLVHLGNDDGHLVASTPEDSGMSLAWRP